MDRNTQDIGQDLGRLAEDARALISATADVAGDRVGEARKRLEQALENGGKFIIGPGIERSQEPRLRMQPFTSILIRP